jgi:S-adenosylmethionine decarboxylase
MLCPQLYRQRLIVEFISLVDLLSEQLYIDFLTELTSMLGMTIFFGPVVGNCKLGPSGWVAWMESGCQIHSFIDYNFIAVDIFSCKPYSAIDVVNLIKKWFKAEEIEIHE